MDAVGEWLSASPILLIGALLFATMLVAALTGIGLRRRTQTPKAASPASTDDDGSAESYIVSAVLGLLALLLGFTFALAVDRFETRRALVLQEANAIGTSYLRSQALPEPHRSRMSAILVEYTDNRIALARATPPETPPFLAVNDRLLDDLWSATLAANDAIQALPLSVSLFSTVNEVIDLDASRKTARRVRVPAEVFVVLWLYIVVTAAILGYARSGLQGRRLAVLLFALVTMAYMLVLDIDRPVVGGIVEKQGPMLELRDTLRNHPPGSYDRWRRAT